MRAPKLTTPPAMQSLSKLCTMRVGGEAKVFIPISIEELQSFIQTSHTNYFPTGLGSNVIFTDKVSDTIIKTYKLNHITLEHNTIKAEAGVSLPKLASFAQKHAIIGAKWLESIPGTVGGALKMNAGCFGYEFWNDVIDVTILTHTGELKTKPKELFTPKYRGIEGIQESDIFISCTLAIHKEDITDAQLHTRYDSQPIGTANCGSVFKNPQGQYAARLIDNAGLKGHRIGGASVSTQHANFIINDNNATSEDVIQLIAFIQTQVKKQFGILLESEVVVK